MQTIYLLQELRICSVILGNFVLIRSLILVYLVYLFPHLNEYKTGNELVQHAHNLLK